MNAYAFEPEPLYTIVAFCTFFAIATGWMFKDLLEEQVNRWYANRQTQGRIEYDRPAIAVLYGTTCLLTFGAIAAGLASFGFRWLYAGGLAALTVAFLGVLVWVQLGSMLALLVRGGSQAIDIDAYGAGGPLDPERAKAPPSAATPAAPKDDGAA